MVNLASFWKHQACGQTVLPDRLVSIGQKLVENAKNLNATFWVIFKQCGIVGKLNQAKSTASQLWIEHLTKFPAPSWSALYCFMTLVHA